MIGYVWLEMLTIISLVFFLFFTRREMNCWAGLELQVVSKSDFTVQIYQKHCLFYVNMVAIYEVTILVVNVILLCSLQLRKSSKVPAASGLVHMCVCSCMLVCSALVHMCLILLRQGCPASLGRLRMSETRVENQGSFPTSDGMRNTLSGSLARWRLSVGAKQRAESHNCVLGVSLFLSLHFSLPGYVGSNTVHTRS